MRSADGFKFNLDVSQIIHIPRNDAPKVIARFGDMSALVTQVLEPTIGNYFRNAAQGCDIIDFLKNRATRQAEAKDSIAAALEEYNVGAVDTLIGDIVPPDELMKTLTDRKIAEQERVTFETQRQAQDVRQELQQATALADTQARVVDARAEGADRRFDANASGEVRRGQRAVEEHQRRSRRHCAAHRRRRRRREDQAVGGAEAEVIKLKIAVMDSANYAFVQVAEAFARGNVKIVPDVVAGGGDSMGGLLGAMIGNMLKNQHEAKGKLEEKPQTAM